MAKSSGEHGKPKRLRPWLENLLNRGETPGLHWIDPEARTMFRVPWKHRGKQDWSPEHSRIFKEWAVQTGRYREGIDEEDYPTWKTRLRCAFNKAPDIEEVRDRRCLDSPEPYRVYRFRTASSSSHVTSGDPAPPATCNKQTDDTSSIRAMGLRRSPTPSRILPTVSNVDMPVLPSYPESLTSFTEEWLQRQSREVFEVDCDTKDFKRPKLDILPEFDTNLESVQAIFTDYYSTPMEVAIVTDVKLCDDVKPDIKIDVKPDIKTDFKMTFPMNAADEENELQLTARYCGRHVMERRVTSPAGCMLCYNETSLTKFLAPEGADVIALPPPDECALAHDKQRSFVQDLLQRGLERGLFIQCVDNNIYVHRSCQCATFYYEQEVTSSPSNNAKRDPIKLRRTEHGLEEKVCVFDYQRYVAALKDYLDGRAPKPEANCVLVFGQSVPYSRKYDCNVLISVTVATTRALEDATKADKAMALRTPDIHMSVSNEFDKLLHQVNLIGMDQSQQEKMEFDFINVPDVSSVIPEVQFSPVN